MTTFFTFEWPMLTVSLFNAILSLWLALTILLNAERRDWGVILAGTGLLASAGFFISHTAIIDAGISVSTLDIDFWWNAGWLAVIVAPFAWYVLMLWYSGYENQAGQLHRRHLVWFILLAMLTIFQVILLAFYSPSFGESILLAFNRLPTVAGVPPLFVVYPLFILMCIGLSLDALARPEPSERMLGDVARQRSRPWLLGATLMLLLVSLIVAAAIWWTLASFRSRYPPETNLMLFEGVAWFDLIVAAMIAVAIVMLGQAIVSYEVFTGKTLPRRGFFRYWNNALILCAGYAAFVSWTLVRQVSPLYSLLTTAMMMISFYALFTWRSFAEREQFMQSVRPFVSSQRLIQQLADHESGARARAEALFKAMAENVLNARQAGLVPLGPLAALAGDALVYPSTGNPSPACDPSMFPDPGTPFQALDESKYSPYRWAIPLQAERGLIGALLLGEKQDGGLYTEEEIVTAQAGGERIIDMLAGEEMARRLMELQRRRLTENTIMDRRARRTLHDEVLPDLHAALLQISALPRTDPAVENAIKVLTGTHRQIADLIHNVSDASLPYRQKNIVDAIRVMLGGEFKDEFDTVSWQVSGEPPALDPLVGEVVYYAVREAVRNSALHGRDKSRNRPLNLTLQISVADTLSITIDDDGIGLRHSHRDESPGAQGGLSLHETMLAVVGGTMRVTDRDEGGTRVEITMPVHAVRLSSEGSTGST